MEDLYNRARFKKITIRSHTRASLYYTFIWHRLFSEIYHQVSYTWLSMLYIYLTYIVFGIYHQVLYTWLSILYIYLTHIVFRDLPSDLIHLALYIIHLFDTYCFQRFTIRSNTPCPLYYTVIWSTMFIKHYYVLLWNGHMILSFFFSDPTSNVLVRLLQESANMWLGNQYVIKNQLKLGMLLKLCYYYYISLFS